MAASAGVLASVLAGAVGASPAAAATAAPAGCTASPRLSSTFLPSYFAAWWDESAWITRLQELKADCITNVIIQYSADSSVQTAYFPPSAPGWSEYPGDPLLSEALSAADSVGGVTVTVGLSISDTWFSEHADPAAMAAQATTDEALAAQLWSLYSAHPSFSGWYLPLEMDSINFQSTTAWQTMATYYSAVAGYLHALTPGLPVMVAPFFSAGAAAGGGQTSAQWQAMWAYILAQAPIDQIAVQDGVGDANAVDGSLGTARVTPAQLAEWFSATAAAIAQARPATQLWDDVELYSPQDDHAMSTAQIVADMSAVAPWVQTFTSFSWFSQLDPAWMATPIYEDAYRSYATSGTVPVEAVAAPGGLSATVPDNHTVSLAWSAASSPDGVAGYYVSRQGTLIALIRGASSTSFTDTDAPSGAVAYTVQAFDAAGNLSAISAVSAAVPAEPYHVDVAAGRPYVSSTPAQSPYADSGTKLTAGTAATASYADPAWQGRVASAPYTFVVDLGAVQAVNQMSLEALDNGLAGIYMPASVSYATSTDGTTFSPFSSTVTRPAVPVAPSVGRYVTTSTTPVSARWVKVTVTPTSWFDDWSFVTDLTVDSFRTPPPAPTAPAPAPPAPAAPAPAPSAPPAPVAPAPGYWAVSAAGRVAAFGAAAFEGDLAGIIPSDPVVGAAGAPDGGGYWLTGSDGGVFSFGDARFYGSTGAMRLNRPVVGMAATADGRGYWLVASDGGIFTFGDARFLGSAVGRLSGAVSALVTSK